CFSILHISLCLLHSSLPHRDLHSFPTRRSSDLRFLLLTIGKRAEPVLSPLAFSHHHTDWFEFMQHLNCSFVSIEDVFYLPVYECTHIRPSAAYVNTKIANSGSHPLRKNRAHW